VKAKRYRCNVERRQEWRNIEVEAKSTEEAKSAADEIASGTPPDDDIAVETTAEEISES